jgi:hypothetical protein
MAVTFTKAAVIALHRGLDQTRRVAGGTFETVLTKGNEYRLVAGVSPKLTGLCMSEGGLRRGRPHVRLDRLPDQRAQIVVVHSTHSS